MSDQGQGYVQRRGALVAAPYVTVIGIVTVISLAMRRGGQSDDGALDLYTGLIAATVGITVFSGLWWAVTSRGAHDVAQWWRGDDPTAHLHLPIWGSATAITLGYLVLFDWFEDHLGLFGMVVLAVVLQLFVLHIVTRHLSRRLARGMMDEEAVSTVKAALAVIAGPLLLHGIVVIVLERPIFTDSVGGDVFVFIACLVPLVILLLYIGFAMLYGAAEAIERTASVLVNRQG